MNVKRDLEGLFGSMRKITDIMSYIQNEQTTAMAYTQKVMCLSCGKGNLNYQPNPNFIQGSNGKVYKIKDNETGKII